MMTFVIRNLTSEKLVNMHSDAVEEIETLKAIYFDELKVSFDGTNQIGDEDLTDAEQVTLTIDLFPSTGDVKEKQLITITLSIELNASYPLGKPNFSLRNSRGLSDESVLEIRNQCDSFIALRDGEPLLYDLIQVVTECLTDRNVPSGSCCICLEGFDSFSKDYAGRCTPVVRTNCFHHLHSPCLVRYVSATLKNIREEEEEWALLNPYQHKVRPKAVLCCPVCREKLPDDCQNITEAEAFSESDDDVKYVPDQGTQKFWEGMRRLYEKQLAQGGIIDTEADERNRLVTVTNSTRSIEVRKSLSDADPRNVMSRPKGNPRKMFSKKP